MHRARSFAVFAALFALCAYAAAPALSDAQSATTAASSAESAQQQEINQLNVEIANYQSQLQQVGANKATLQSAINTLNLQKSKLRAQVALTQTKISQAQSQISRLGKTINADQQKIKAGQLALADDIRTEAEYDGQPLVVQVLSSNELSSVWNDVQDMTRIDAAVRGNVQTLQAQAADLMNSKTATQAAQSTLVAQKSTLTSQQKDLTNTAVQKQQLLIQTKAQESQYERLLAQAEAQLNSFSNFSQNAGGSAILGGQTACDSWGCYYNQRDSLWGDDALNGTRFTMKSDGCLVTTMAMVMTHYGARSVTPETINDDPSNFAAYEPAFLLLTINAGGMTATRKASTIDATLATGNPVIVGLRALGGTHFVVIVSGSKGDYVVKDPYFADGNNASFSEHYTLKEIYAIDKVQVS